MGTTAARQRLSLLPDLGKGKRSEKTTLWAPGGRKEVGPWKEQDNRGAWRSAPEAAAPLTF